MTAVYLRLFGFVVVVGASPQGYNYPIPSQFSVSAQQLQTSYVPSFRQQYIPPPLPQFSTKRRYDYSPPLPVYNPFNSVHNNFQSFRYPTTTTPSFHRFHQQQQQQQEQQLRQLQQHQQLQQQRQLQQQQQQQIQQQRQLQQQQQQLQQQQQQQQQEQQQRQLQQHQQQQRQLQQQKQQQIQQQRQLQQQQQQPIITKHFYFHSAPEDYSEQQPRVIRIGAPRRNYRVIFIKAPSPSRQSSISVIPSQNEERTVIYVLTRHSDASDIKATIQNPQVKPSKPEVFFIKYKTQAEALHAQRQIQAQFETLGGSTQISDEEIAPVSSVIGSAGTSGSDDASSENKFQLSGENPNNRYVPQIKKKKK